MPGDDELDPWTLLRGGLSRKPEAPPLLPSELDQEIWKVIKNLESSYHRLDYLLKVNQPEDQIGALRHQIFRNNAVLPMQWIMDSIVALRELLPPYNRMEP